MAKLPVPGHAEFQQKEMPLRARLLQQTPTVTSAIAVIISALALTVSIHETRLSNEGTASAVYDRTETMILDLDKTFLAHPALRPYFYDNQPLALTDGKGDETRALAELTLDTYEIILSELRDHPDRYQGKDEYDAWIADGFRNSTVLSKYFDAHSRWYSPALQALRREGGGTP